MFIFVPLRIFWFDSCLGRIVLVFIILWGGRALCNHVRLSFSVFFCHLHLSVGVCFRANLASVALACYVLSAYVLEKLDKFLIDVHSLLNGRVFSNFLK